MHYRLTTVFAYLTVFVLLPATGQRPVDDLPYFYLKYLYLISACLAGSTRTNIYNKGSQQSYIIQSTHLHRDKFITSI